ncbi:MAG: tRNA lysidine(34) synthetase TilS [Tannerellaceae bacterium]|jgi:tRNA(Ile)-lysidine synthase|nr:tRNA lysidine(34) synthetase TilS [Tannerellaceae bacterium]
MLSIVHAYINKYHLLSGEKPVIVGLSGGQDSVALLTILIRLGYRCIAAHCNFHLRNEESDRDEVFAKNFANRLGIPFYKTDFDTIRHASEKHISIEMTARELRYCWFEELRRQLGGQAIAIAHHRDDSIETLLINLIRGTGIKGLKGIEPKNGFVVRPLLAIGRAEIQAWITNEQLSYVTDSSNLSEIYVRNFIRLRVLPLLEDINPSVKEAIARTSGYLSAVETIYISVIEKAKTVVIKDGNRISISELLQFPSPEAILYELLSPFHFTRVVTENIFASLHKEAGKIFYSPTHRLIKDRNALLISSLEETKTIRLYTIDNEEGMWHGPIKLSFKKTIVDKSFHLSKNKSYAYFDYDKLKFPLLVRIWQPGDWFIPFGMKGRKKLSDYFVDHQYSLIDKEKVWLLCSGENIIWIIGERIDNRFGVNKTTKYVLSVFFSRNDVIDV